MADVKFNLIKHLCSFSENKGWRKEVNLISWNDAPAKIDIRNWKPDGTPGKGISLTPEEARMVAEAILNEE